MKRVLVLFLAGSILGWLIDTAYRSLTEGHFVEGGLLSTLAGIPIPFLPVYGIGLAAVYFVSRNAMHPLGRFVVLAIILSTLEFIGGMFLLVALGERLWYYPNGFYGLVDLLHTFYWGVLGLLAHLLLKRIRWYTDADSEIQKPFA